MRIGAIAFVLLMTLPAGAAEPAGAIDGTITDDGQAVPGALVAAIGPTRWKPAAIARSDAQGHFHLGPLPPAKYGVTATADNHTAGFTLGVVVAAGNVHADVKLGGESNVVSGTIADDTTGKP